MARCGGGRRVAKYVRSGAIGAARLPPLVAKLADSLLPYRGRRPGPRCGGGIVRRAVKVRRVAEVGVPIEPHPGSLRVCQQVVVGAIEGGLSIIVVQRKQFANQVVLTQIGPRPKALL